MIQGRGRMAGDRGRASSLTLAAWAEREARRARRAERRETLRLWCEDMAGLVPLVVGIGLVLLMLVGWGHG